MATQIQSTHINSIPNQLQRPERHNLFEEIERVVPCVRMRERGNSRRAWPRDDGGQEDADEDGTFDAVEHQEHCKDTATRQHDAMFVISLTTPRGNRNTQSSKLTRRQRRQATPSGSAAHGSRSSSGDRTGSLV